MSSGSVSKWLRWVVGPGCILASIWILRRASPEEGLLPLAGSGLFAAMFFVAGVICISPEIRDRISNPLTNLIDRIYLGASGVAVPPLDLKLARHYRSVGRLDEALGEYRRVREWHPGSVEIWVEGILTLRELGYDDEAGRWYRCSRKYIKEAVQQRLLEQAMTQTTERLSTRER